MSTSGPGKNNDEIVSLEDLVNGADADKPAGGPVSPGGRPAPSGSAKSGTLTPESIDMARVDALLDEADPSFLGKIAELRAEKLTGDIEVDGFDDDEFDQLEKKTKSDIPPPPKPKGPGLKALIKAQLKKLTGAAGEVSGVLNEIADSAKEETKTVFMDRVKNAAKGVVAALKGSVGRAKDLFKKLRSLPLSSKLSVLGIVLLAITLVAVVRQMSKGGLMPDIEVRFVPTVAAEADRSWTFDEHEEWDEFNSPLRHPEHVVLLNKIVVNLRPSESSDENPMGYFEFYIEANSQDAAVEIGDRQSEMIDAVQRTIEAITYDEIITPTGKNKLKLVIRKNLNQVLTKGRVRKVFYKSVVIKP